MISPLDLMAPLSCICGWGDIYCVCNDTEKALRLTGRGMLQMTYSQREWCLEEIETTNGYRRFDYRLATDAQVASGVLQAWSEYHLDKGLR